MAFGDLLGTLTGNGKSVTNPSDAAGSVVVSIGDLIVGVMAEQTSLTVSAVTDNLGNSYTAQNAGSLSGTVVSGRMFYSFVTVGGTLTTVHFAATASAHNYALAVAVIAGPLGIIDANPANLLDDLTSPYTCPASGTLTTASEVVIAWKSANSSGVSETAVAPNLLALLSSDTAFLANIDLGYQAVSSTNSVSPEFAGGTGTTGSVLGTASFKASGTAWAGTVTFAATGSFLANGLVVSPALAPFNGSGSFLALANLIPNQAIGTFAGSGSFLASANLKPSQAIVTYSGTGSLFADTLVLSPAIITFNGTGSFLANAAVGNSAIATFTPSGSLSVTAFLGETAAATFAAAGLLSLNTISAQAASVTYSGVGSFFANTISAQQAFVEFDGAGSLFANTSAVTAWQASAEFDGAGLLAATAFIRQPAIVTFAGTGSFLVTAFSAQRATATFAGTGSFALTAFSALAARVTFAGAGSLFVDTSKSKQGIVEFDGTGLFRATAFSAQQSAVTFAPAGNFSAVVFIRQPAFLTLTGAGSLFADTRVIRAARVTFAGAGGFSATSLGAGIAQLATVEFDGAGSLFANGKIPLQMAVAFACTGSLYANISQVHFAAGGQEMAILGNVPAVSKFVACDIMSDQTRIMYILYGPNLTAVPQLFFHAPNDWQFIGKSPQVQVGTLDILTCKGFFPANEYVKVLLDVTRLQAQAGVWSVSSIYDGPGQKFYVSAED